MTLHEIILPYVPWIMGAIFSYFVLSRILSYRYATMNKSRTQHRQAMSQKPNEEMKAYIENPEQSIAALMAQRKIFEKEGNPEKLQSIDSQIKMLQQVSKIPPMFRPTLLKIGEKVMKRAEGAFDI